MMLSHSWGMLLLVVPSKTMPLVIATALIVVTIFSLTNRKAGLTTAAANTPSLRREGGRGRLHILPRYLWRVLFRWLCRVVDSRFRRLFLLHLHRGGGVDESFEHVFIAGRHASFC